MPHVAIHCVTTGKPISTGLDTAEQDIEKLPNIRTFTQRPRGGLVHGWFVGDDWLEDEIAS